MRIIKRTVVTAFVFLLLVCIASLTASAEFSLSIERKQQGETIVQRMKVEGVASKELRYKPVSLIILRPGMNVDSVADFEDKYAAVYQTYVRADNKYVFYFPFNEAEGEYTVLVRVNNNDITDKTIKCYSIDELVFLLDGIKNKTLSVEEVCNLLTGKYENLGVDGSLFSKLGESTRLGISEAIMNSMTEFTVDELSEKLYEKTFTSVFTSSDTQELREEVISAYNGMYSDEIQAACGKFISLDTEIRKNVLEETKRRNVKSFEDIIRELPDSCFICEYRAIDNFSEIKSLASAYEQDARIAAVKASLDAFNDLRQNIIMRNILKRSGEITGIDSFVNIFNLTAADIVRLEMENNMPSGPIGGGGGGGGGYASGSENEIKVTPPEKEDKEEKEDYTETVPKTEFEDIYETQWAIEAIKALTSEKILNGREDGKFAPNDNITRAEFSKISALAFGIETKNDEESPFKDVPDSHWAHGYVKSLYQNGFIQGVSPDSFNPNAEITRQDIATILFRIVSMRGHEFNMESFGVDFADKDKMSGYAVPAIGMLSHKGIILGFEDNEFKPLNKATRAETAVVIHRLMKMLETEGI